jgi:putative endonuclease
MYYVYIIESVSVPGHFYIGYTEELRERVRKHQADVSSHAAKFRPWKLKVYFAFESKETALRLERLRDEACEPKSCSVTDCVDPDLPDSR